MSWGLTVYLLSHQSTFEVLCLYMVASHFQEVHLKKKKLEKNQRKVNKTVKEKRKPTGTRLLFCAWHQEC